MNLMHIQYFIVIAECLNFTEASKKLYVSQPTLSHSITVLEKQLGVKLFIREHHSVTLSPAGESLYSIAIKIKELIDQAYVDVKAASKAELNTLNIGFLGDLLPHCFPEVISPFLVKYPKLRSRLDQKFVYMLHRGLISGQHDVIITRSSSLDDCPIAESSTKILFKDRFCLVVSANHPYAKYDYIDDLSIFKDDVFIQMDPKRTSPLNEKLIRICESRNYCPKIKASESLLDAVLPQVACGMGITIAPRSHIYYKSISNLKRIDLGNSKDLDNDIIAIWMQNNKNHALKIFLDYINETF